MYISDGKTHLSYSLLCSSALSNEERENIVRKSNQRKREIYNKYNDHYLQLEPAKKKQRYSLMDGAKKEELLETCAKKISVKKLICQKRNKCLKIEEKSIKRWMHQKRNKCLTEKL